MRLIIKPSQGAAFEVETEAWESIADLKRKIAAARADFPVARLQLLHAGAVIQDDTITVEKQGLTVGNQFVVVKLFNAEPRTTNANAAVASERAACKAHGNESVSEAKEPSLISDTLGSHQPACQSLAVPATAAQGQRDNGARRADLDQAANLSAPNDLARRSDPILDQLVTSSEFPILANMVEQNPQLLDQILETLGSTHPDVAQAIQNDKDHFLQLVRSHVRGRSSLPVSPSQPQAQNSRAPGQPESRSSPAVHTQARGRTPDRSPTAVANQLTQLTNYNVFAVDRLSNLGFERDIAARAYLACMGDEDLAASCLFQDMPWPPGADAFVIPPATSDSVRDGADVIDNLRNDPLFPQLAQEVVQNPQLLEKMVSGVLDMYPDVGRAITAEPLRFFHVAREVAGVSAPYSRPFEQQNTSAQTTAGDCAALETLMAMGFERRQAEWAYVSCNRNTERAAGVLLQSGPRTN